MGIQYLLSWWVFRCGWLSPIRYLSLVYVHSPCLSHCLSLFSATMLTVLAAKANFSYRIPQVTSWETLICVSTYSLSSVQKEDGQSINCLRRIHEFRAYFLGAWYEYSTNNYVSSCLYSSRNSSILVTSNTWRGFILLVQISLNLVIASHWILCVESGPIDIA